MLCYICLFQKITIIQPRSPLLFQLRLSLLFLEDMQARAMPVGNALAVTRMTF